MPFIWVDHIDGCFSDYPSRSRVLVNTEAINKISPMRAASLSPDVFYSISMRGDSAIVDERGFQAILAAIPEAMPPKSQT